MVKDNNINKREKINVANMKNKLLVIAMWVCFPLIYIFVLIGEMYESGEFKPLITFCDVFNQLTYGTVYYFLKKEIDDIFNIRKMKMNKKLRVLRMRISYEEYDRLIRLVSEICGYESVRYLKFERQRLSSPYTYYSANEADCQWSLDMVRNGSFHFKLRYNEFFPDLRLSVDEKFNSAEELIIFLTKLL